MGIVNGSISYLYTTKPLLNIPASKNISLRDAIAGYRVLSPLQEAEDPMYWEIWKDGKRVDTKAMLLYGRMYLPQNSVEAMVVRRLSPVTQLLIKAVSDSQIKNGGAVSTSFLK